MILLATLTTLVPYAFSAAAQAWLWLVEREKFDIKHMVRDIVIATLAFAYSVWAIAGAGDDIVTKGFLLLLAASRSTSACAGGRTGRSSASSPRPRSGRWSRRATAMTAEPRTHSRPPRRRASAASSRGSTSARRSARCAGSSSTGPTWSSSGSRRATRTRCCSTTSCGSGAPARSTTRSRTRSPSAASRSSTSRRCWPTMLAMPRVREQALEQTLAAVDLGPSPRARGGGVARRRAGRRAGRPADRRHRLRRAARSGASALSAPGAGARRLRAPAAAQPPLHARHVGVDLRRRVHQRHGQGRPPARERAPTRRSTATTRCSPTCRTTVWCDQLGGAAQLEGGDVLVIGNGCVLIGMGERTRPAGVERLAGGCSRPAPRAR